MADQAALFDGMVHAKRTDEMTVVSVLWHDPQHVVSDKPLDAQPMQLWVC
jgi:hypothetical protein